MSDRLAPSSMTEKALLLFTGLALALDLSSVRAYNDHEAFTEIVGGPFFLSLKEVIGLSVPTTFFELLSYSFMLWIVLRWGWQSSRFWLSLLLAASLIPLAALGAFSIGLVQGQNMSLGATQIHALPLIGVWLINGYFLGTREGAMARFFSLLFWIALWRSLYALYVYAFVYQLSMEGYEYLIDHPSSIFLCLGGIYAAYQILLTRKRAWAKLGYAVALALIFGVYVLNDRRASFGGLIAFLGLLPFILPRFQRRRLLPIYLSGVSIAVVAVLILGAYTVDPNSLIGGLTTEIPTKSQLTYRHIENFNLLNAVVEKPLFGLGFGTNYPQVLELPDISFAFELFQAIPHNTVYFLWAFAGPFGIACFATLATLAMILALRCGRHSLRGPCLIHALLALGMIMQWLMFSFYDMGLLEGRTSMLFGVLIGSLFPLYARILKENVHEQQASDHRPHREQSSALPVRSLVQGRRS